MRPRENGGDRTGVQVTYGSPPPLALAAPVDRRNLLSAWWRLTAPVEPAASASFDERERFRRGHLVSVLLLATLVILVGAFWQYVIVDNDHPAMVLALVVALALAIASGFLNRFGWVSLAGMLLVIVADLPAVGIPATASDARLDVLHLGTFYLLAGSELVAASVLPPWSVFPVAVVNSLIVAGMLSFLPHTPALTTILTSNNAQQAYAGPIVLQLIVALVSYLWAQSMLSALKRADRAEEIAELERREVERTRELEEGVHQLLAVHVQMANGDFSVRVPPVHNMLLWQVGSSLNNLIGRFARLAQIEYLLRRTQGEGHRVAEAVLLARSGRQPIWPAPSGTPMDEVITALTSTSMSVPQSPHPSQTLQAPPWSPQGYDANSDPSRPW